jgi:hypothetical protein
VHGEISMDMNTYMNVSRPLLTYHKTTPILQNFLSTPIAQQPCLIYLPVVLAVGEVTLRSTIRIIAADRQQNHGRRLLLLAG